MSISSINSTLMSTLVQNTSVKKSSTEISAASSLPNSEQTSGEITSHDFTNMTPKQLLETVNTLIKTGKMSLDESSSLVPIMGAAAPLGKIAVDGGSPYAPDKPIDVLAMLQQSIAFNKSVGNSAGVLYDEKAYSALHKLQGTVSGINISA